MTKINEIVTINFVYKKVMITIKIYLFTRHTHTYLNFVSVDTMETLSVKCGKIMAFLLTQQPEKMTWIVAFLPISLQLCILIHFSSQQMIQYLKCWPRLYLLEKKCTDQEFQLFLIELMRHIEQDNQLRFQSVELNLRFDLEHFHTHFDEQRQTFLTSAHFSTQALGFGHVLYHVWRDGCYEYYMFVRKFNMKVVHLVYPLTKLPLSVSMFIKDKNVLHKEMKRYILLPAKSKHIEKKKKPNYPNEKNLPVKEKFCLRLIHLFCLFHTKKFHECMFKCVEILDTFQNHHFSYKMHVYGCLAICLSVFHCSDVAIRTCLKAMKSLLIFTSDRYDYYFVKQYIYHVKNNMEKERKMFYLIFNDLPKTSLFCANALKLHLKSQLQWIENTFVEVMCLKNKTVITRAYLRQEIYFRQNVLLKTITTLKKIIYNILTLTEQSHFKKCEDYLLILNVYLSVTQQLEYDFQVDDHLKPVKMLGLSSHPLHFLAQLLDYENVNYTITHYIEDMSVLKKNIIRRNHDKNSKHWAEVCFTHFMFLHLTHPLEHITSQLKAQATSFYQRHAHYRAILLQEMSDNSTVSFENQNSFVNMSKQYFSYFSLSALFKIEPKLKYIILAGKTSMSNIKFK